MTQRSKIVLAVAVIILIILAIVSLVMFLSRPKTFQIQGMNVEVQQGGSGQAAQVGDKVTVHYVGTLENGTKFDSSIYRNRPFSFVVGANRVIKGWDLGIVGMKTGEKRRLTIPPELAYGSRNLPTIPPNSTLIFEVEMLSIEPSQQ